LLTAKRIISIAAAEMSGLPFIIAQILKIRAVLRGDVDE
jgi:hypothetical protein